MQTQGFLLLAISIPNLLLASFIFLRNINDRVNIFFALLATSTGIWSLGLAGFIFANDATVAMIWAQAYYIAAALIAFSFALFSLAYTNKLKTNLKTYLLLGIPFFMVVIILIFFRNLILIEVEYNDWGKGVLLNKPGYIAYGLYFTSYVVAGFVAIISSMLQATGVRRLYLRYIFAGLVIAFSLGATFNLFYPFFNHYEYIWVGPLFTLAYVSFVSYAIIRHKLFDIRFIVVRSVAYVMSLGAIAAIYGILTYALSTTFFKGIRDTSLELVVNVAVLLLVAVTFGTIKRTFDKITNSLFYRDAYDPQIFLDQLNKVVVTNVDVEELLRGSADVIDTHLKSQFSAFSLRETAYASQRLIGGNLHRVSDDDLAKIGKLTAHIRHRVIVADELEGQAELQDLLRSNNIAVIARLVTTLKYEVEGVGYLLLGSKKSGNPYSKKDQDLIRLVAGELVIAVENALRFEEIENFNLTLQEKVNDATKKLKRANEKLKALDETKDEFISMASHQLRTPLTSVKGYVSMVLEGDAGPLNEMQTKLLEQSFTSSQRMVFLIADLLNLSRLKTGKFIIDAKPTNLSDVIQGEVEQLKETAEGRKLKLVYNRPESFPVLMLDETKIRQVIMNFVDNAIYYTPSGGKIEINLQEKDKSVEFTVKDDGIGVPEAEQHHLFNKFYRAKNAQKARPDGTGLGLFMAKKVIVSQGGALLFESKVGKGSTFGFSFSKQKLMIEDPPKPPKPH